MATLYIDKKDEYIGGMRHIKCEPVLLGVDFELESSGRTTFTNGSCTTQLETALYHVIDNLTHDKNVNKDSLPELTILKRTKKDLTLYAKEAIKKLEEDGIIIKIERYKKR